MMKPLIQDVTNGRLRSSIKPEERLLLAVVESAYWDLQSPEPGRRRTARHYFLDEADRHTFSFISVCQHFSWSPNSIRLQLKPFLGSSEAAPAREANRARL